jgi:propionyl-CoA synthetase
VSTASPIEPRAGASRYHEAYQQALHDPIGFWGAAADGIDWYEKPAKIFDPSAGVYGRWYVGATCNTCFNAVDRAARPRRSERHHL